MLSFNIANYEMDFQGGLASFVQAPTILLSLKKFDNTYVIDSGLSDTDWKFKDTKIFNNVKPGETDLCPGLTS